MENIQLIANMSGLNELQQYFELVFSDTECVEPGSVCINGTDRPGDGSCLRSIPSYHKRILPDSVNGSGDFSIKNDTNHFHILFYYKDETCSLFQDKYNGEHHEWLSSCVTIRRVSKLRNNDVDDISMFSTQCWWPFLVIFDKKYVENSSGCWCLMLMPLVTTKGLSPKPSVSNGWSPTSVINIDIIEEFILFLCAWKTRTRLRTHYEQKLSYIEYNLGEMKIRTNWIGIFLCILIASGLIGILILIFVRWRRHLSQRDERLNQSQRSSNTEMMSLQYYRSIPNHCISPNYRPGQGITNDFDKVSFLFKGHLNTDFRSDIRSKILEPRTSIDLTWPVGNLFGTEESKMLYRSQFNFPNIKSNWKRKFWGNNTCFLWWSWTCLQDAEATE